MYNTSKSPETNIVSSSASHQILPRQIPRAPIRRLPLLRHPVSVNDNAGDGAPDGGLPGQMTISHVRGQGGTSDWGIVGQMVGQMVRR